MVNHSEWFEKVATKYPLESHLIVAMHPYKDGFIIATNSGIFELHADGSLTEPVLVLKGEGDANRVIKNSTPLPLTNE